MTNADLICAACQHPIKPDEFYVKALRGDEGDTPDSIVIAGHHRVHVPLCPNPHTDEEWQALHPPTLEVKPA